MTKKQEPDYPLAAEQHQKEFFDKLPNVVSSKDYDSSMFSYLKDPLVSKRMDNVTVPIYINDEGYKTITIPTKEFVCAGQSEPFDHPHVFLTMGNNDFKLCPYCSTRFEYDNAET